jgi:hypothetical protein
MRKIGVNPDELRECKSCEMDYPLYLYSVNKDSKVFDKCRVCFAIENYLDRYKEEFLREWRNSRKETISQRSIRILGERIKAAGTDWRAEHNKANPNEESFEDMIKRMSKKTQ